MPDEGQERADIAARFSNIRSRGTQLAVMSGSVVAVLLAASAYPTRRVNYALGKAIAKYAGPRVLDASAQLPSKHVVRMYEASGVVAVLVQPFVPPPDDDVEALPQKELFAMWRDALRHSEPWAGSSVQFQVDQDPEGGKVTVPPTCAVAVETLNDVALPEAKLLFAGMARRVEPGGHVIVAGPCEPRSPPLRSITGLLQQAFGATALQYDPLAWAADRDGVRLVEHTYSLLGTHCVAVYAVEGSR